MAGTLKINRQQLGDSATATQNFTITAEAADGTMKIARGNAGATTQDILTVDSSGKVILTQGIPINGIPGLTITSSQTTPLPAAASLLSYTHGLGATPVWADVELICLTADLGYSTGDAVGGFTSGSAAYAHPFSINRTATVVEARVGSTAGFYVVNKTTGAATLISNLSSWAWRFKVRVS